MGVAPVAGKVAAPVARTAAKIPGAVAALPDVGRGFTGTISGRIAKPGTEPILYKQTAPVMEPAGKTHIPADVMAEYQANRITPEQAAQQSVDYTPAQIEALKRTGGNVPYSGNVAQATGAILAEPYTSFRGYLPDLGLAALGGLTTGGLGAIGFPAANLVRKGLQAYNAAKTVNAANELGNLKFTPLSAEQRAALSAAQAAGPVQPPPAAGLTGRTFPVEPTLPLLSYDQTGQTPIPMAGPGRRVNIEGESYNLPYQIDTSPVQSARPQPITPVAPSSMASQVAPEIPQATAQSTGKTPVAPVVAETPAPLRKETAPHENTAAIEQSLQQKVESNPTLQGFDRQYVIPQSIKESVENFLNNNTKHAVVYGGPGTGKTSMANEWLARNPDGQIVYIDPVTFNSKQQQRLQDASLTKGKTLYVVDEADKFKKAQVTQLTNLMDATSTNGKFLITSNDINKVAKEFKTGEMAQIKVDPKLSADERSAFALNVARQFNVNKTPAEIEAIAQNPALQSFRDIKREVSKGYTVKEEPMMSAPSVVGKIDVPEPVSTLIDDFRNNLTPKNVLIVEKSAFKTDPDLSTKLDKVAAPLPMDKAVDVIPQALARSNAASPTYRVVIRNAEDAAQISVFKGLMERSNETAYPTKVIIDDRFGHLDDAIKSRAELINGDMMKKTSGQVIDDVVQRGQNLGVIKQPKNPPSGVSQMMTDRKVFDSKADYEAQVLLDRLAGKPTTGSFVDNGMRYEITEIDYGNVPKDLLKRMNKPLTEVRVFSEKNNKQISGPAPEVPEKSLRERVEDKIRKRK